MDILTLRALRGPNLWSQFPTIYMKLDLEEFTEKPTHKLAGFTNNLMKLVPSLYEHRCGVGKVGGFEGRMLEGTYLGHVIEHLAIELQCMAGMEVGFGKTRETLDPGVYHVVFRYRDEKAGLEAGRQAVHVVQEMADGKSVEIEPLVQKLRELREDNILGPSTYSIVKEAMARDIPFLRLNQYSLVQLGWGNQQQRIQATLSGRTSALGVEIADDKFLTKELLQRAGVPVPEGAVTFSLDEALDTAEDIGYPVTVKPLIGNHGRGITVCVLGKKDMKAAYESAKEIYRHVIVERHLEGFDFRILVIDHCLVAAAHRTPAHVVGNGKNTIRELIDEVNRGPGRGYGHEKVLTYITPDEMTDRFLNEIGLDLDSIPEPKRIVRLKSTANLSTGGTAEDVTDLVHSANRFMAERISRIIDIDIIGIDIIAPSLETPIAQTGGGVVEVNAAPGFRMHLSPTKGKPRRVAVPVVDMLFGLGNSGRVPLVAVTGTNGKTTTVRLISHLLRTVGRHVGTTTTDSVLIGNHRVLSGDYSGPEGTGVVLQDPNVDAAVIEIARGGILRRGLGYDVADVAVVLNVAEDHLGLDDIHDLESLAEVKRVVADAVHPKKGRIILNADDPRVLAMKKDAKAPVILFSLHPDSEAVRQHLSEGGTVFILEESSLAVRHGDSPSRPIVKVFEVPITLGGRALYNVSNALAAAAASHALLDLRIEDLRAGLSTFSPSIGQSPGRLNRIEIAGIDYLVDYAHNVPAAEALQQVVLALSENRPENYRRIGVVSGTGNRREKDIFNLGKTVAATYTDLIICDPDPRGRDTGDTAEIMKRGVLDTGFPKEKVRVVLDEKEAIRAAITSAKTGDLVGIHPDDIAGALKLLLEHKEKSESIKIPVPKKIEG